MSSSWVPIMPYLSYYEEKEAKTHLAFLSAKMKQLLCFISVNTKKRRQKPTWLVCRRPFDNTRGFQESQGNDGIYEVNQLKSRISVK